MKFAYADPPYLGLAGVYKRSHPEALVWNEPDTHRTLIEKLCCEYQDGWAMSLAPQSLRIILPMCPEQSRVLVWVKPFAPFKPDWSVAFTWEPVVLVGGRKRTRQQRTVRDHLSEPIILKRGGSLAGAKPSAFVHWILDVLNVQRGDQVDDLFPGTGVVGRCVEARVSGHATLDDLPLGEVVADCCT